MSDVVRRLLSAPGIDAPAFRRTWPLEEIAVALTAALEAARLAGSAEGADAVDTAAAAIAELSRDRDRAWDRVARLEAVIAAVRQEVGP